MNAAAELLPLLRETYSRLPETRYLQSLGPAVEIGGADEGAA